MKNINWKVRFKNKKFVVSLVSFIILNVQIVAAYFGYSFDLDGATAVGVAIINIIFGVLAFLGFVQDPTTAGYSDSERSMAYTEPK
jgi:phi LC3 family holin